MMKEGKKKKCMSAWLELHLSLTGCCQHAKEQLSICSICWRGILMCMLISCRVHAKAIAMLEASPLAACALLTWL